jgi:hypothetical protein
MTRVFFADLLPPENSDIGANDRDFPIMELLFLLRSS